MTIHNSAMIFLVIMSGTILAQEDSSLNISDQLIENVVPEPITNNEEFNVIDYLEELQKNPININTADISALQRIPLLDLNYAQLIIQHREKYGRFFSINELFSIKGLPKYIINNIKPFINVSDIHKQNSNLEPMNTSMFEFVKIILRSRFSYDINDNYDLSFHNYQGSRPKLYNRLSISNEYFDAGMLTEKDPGERSYYDFISFHLLIKNIGLLEKVILGDYIFDFGQGLVLWGPYRISKTTDAIIPTKRTENSIRQYNSADENQFLRGISTSYKWNEFHFSFFFSSHNLDASVDSLSGKVTSLMTSGYHRTSSELNNHNSIKEILWGGSINYTYEGLFNAGVLIYSTNFSNSLSGNDFYTPQGNRFKYLSTSYEIFLIPSIIFSGETACDFKSFATINNMQICLNKNFLFVSSIRNYPSNFISIHGNSLAEQSNKVRNETGFYNGFKLLTNYGTINFYYDQFKFPSGGYRFPTSSAGEEFLLSYSNTFNDNISIKANYKYENKDYIQNQEEQKTITRRGRNDIRLILSWNVSKEIRLKSAANYNVIRIREENMTEDGFLLSNSILINAKNNFKISIGISFFKTDSYFSSVYEYDNNIAGLVRGNVLYGEGTKLNIFLSYVIFKLITISGQYREVIKPRESLVNPNSPIITKNIIFQFEAIL
jgi:hypothetical protein